MPGAFQAWYPNTPLPFLLSLCGGKGLLSRQWRATYASKVKERHDLWLTLLPEVPQWDPGCCLNCVQTAFGEDGRYLIFQWDDSVCINRDGSRKGISWFSEPLLCSAHTWVVWQNIQASALMLGQIFWKCSSFTAKAALGLVFCISLLKPEITQCGPYYPWPNNTTVGKNLGCHLSVIAFWSLIPFHTL